MDKLCLVMIIFNITDYHSFIVKGKLMLLKFLKYNFNQKITELTDTFIAYLENVFARKLLAIKKNNAF